MRLPLVAMLVATVVLVGGIVFWRTAVTGGPAPDEGPPVIAPDEGPPLDIILKYRPKDPPGVNEPIVRDPVAELRETLARIPAERKFVVSEDIIGVMGPSDPHNLSSPLVLTLHHIPSLTVITIDQSGREVSRTVRGADGVKPLADVLADLSVREAMKDAIETLKDGLEDGTLSFPN